jgi:CoA-dependent NAD(P)H sulfur oxidoreductase
VERIVIVGGNAAGMSAAARAKRVNRDLDITVVESGAHVAYSICGAPFLISGELREASGLVHFTPEEFQSQRGSRVLAETEAVHLQPGLKRLEVLCRRSGRRDVLAYDRLLLATGYKPRRPRIQGLDHPLVFTLARLPDALAIRDLVDAGQVRDVLLVGGGYIGLELCEALRRRGCRVLLVEESESVLGTLDRDMSEIVARELRLNGIELALGSTVGELRKTQDAGRIAALLQPAESWSTVNLVLIDIGVEPNVELAERAGIRLGRSGAIEVTERLETSVFGVYAAGNCAEAFNLVSGRCETSCLATVASKQGRAAGDNLAGRLARFGGHVGTSILRVFGLEVGSTGLNTSQALSCGFRADAVKISAPVAAAYLPESTQVTLKVVFDRSNGRLLGAQAIGPRGVAARINVLAACLHQRQTVEEAAQLDLAYAPSFSQAWDPVHVAMHAAQRVMAGRAR